MKLGERIKAARKEAKLTQAALAKAAGLNQATISQLESDVMSSSTALPAIAKALNVNSYWLLTGLGDKQGIEPQVVIESNVQRVKASMGPVLSWVQAGTFTNVQAVDRAQIEEWLPLPEDCDQCFYLKVQGMSNYPTFQEGDYILVDPTVHYCDMQSGDIIVVRKNEDATFKRLVIETDGSRYLQALNPDFRPNIIPLDEDCIFVGEVVDSIRYLYKSKRRSKMKPS
jgi:SOS-response transcriptional repressor LexA